MKHALSLLLVLGQLLRSLARSEKHPKDAQDTPTDSQQAPQRPPKRSKIDPRSHPKRSKIDLKGGLKANVEKRSQKASENGGQSAPKGSQNGANIDQTSHKNHSKIVLQSSVNVDTLFKRFRSQLWSDMVDFSSSFGYFSASNWL